MKAQTAPALESITNPIVLAGVFAGMAVFVLCAAVMIVASMGVLWKLGYFSGAFWKLTVRKKVGFARDSVMGFGSNDTIAAERRWLGRGLSYGFLSFLVFGALVYLYGQPGA